MSHLRSKLILLLNSAKSDESARGLQTQLLTGVFVSLQQQYIIYTKDRFHQTAFRMEIRKSKNYISCFFKTLTTGAKRLKIYAYTAGVQRPP